MFAKIEVKEGTPVNNLGWEIYPEGLYRICKKYYEKYKAPIFITENGTCDADDSLRVDYLADHLDVIARLVEEGVPVERYYHWTLMDNFEWVEGESARFGLIENDFQTQKRTIRKSGRLFADIAKEKGLTKEIIKKYSTG
jgi:beta-glucosidase